MGRLLKPGTIIKGAYKLFDCIGQGGMGCVYEAEHVETGQRFAVKILHPDLAQKQDVRARFEREVQAASRVDHENVCKVVDSGVEDDGALFLVMPLLDGRSLKEVIAEDEEVPLERAVAITLQILDALAVAHDRGVIHRDLKPANVFLTCDGDREDFVKVLDFGVTKLEDPRESEPQLSSLTHTGAVLGTPTYMAPEQARGSKEITGQVDVYAVGVILYEMLTGQRPIVGENYNEVLWKIWNAPVKPPSAHRPDIPAALEAVVMKALARSRTKRYPDARAMRQDLAVALTAAAPSEGGASWRDERDNDALTLSLVGDAVANPVQPSGDDDTVPGDQAATDTPAHESRPPARYGARGVAAAALAGALVAAVGAAAFLWLMADDGVAPAEGSPADVPTEPAAAAVGMTPEDAAPARVRITLVGAPEGADLLVDGRRVRGPSFEVVASEAIALRIVADGYEPWERQIAATADLSLPVQLVRVATVEPAPVEPLPPGPRPLREPAERPGFGPLDTFGVVP